MNKERDELEKLIIMGLVNYKDNLTTAFDILGSGDFLDLKHRKIYEIIIELKRTNTPIDIFEVNKKFNDISYLVELPLDNLGLYNPNVFYRKCLRLKELSLQTQIDITLKRYYKNQDSDILEKFESLKHELNVMTSQLYANKDIDAKEAVILFNQEVEKRLQFRGLIPSGINEFDRQFGGFDKGDLVALAARTSIGKTALGLSGMYNQIKMGYKVHYLSYEMTLYQLMLRLFAQDRGLNLDEMRKDIRTIPNFEKELFEFSKQIQEHSFIFDFKKGNDLYVVNKIKSVKERFGTDIVYVDSLDYVSHSDRTIKNEAKQIGSVTKNLKSCALELEIPIVILVQLNRGAEGEEKKLSKVAPLPPRLHHFKHSGDIEQDIDTAVFIDRPSKEGYEQYCDGVSCIGTARLIVRKQRMGKLGRCTVAFNELNARFQDESISGVINPNYNPNGFAPDADF